MLAISLRKKWQLRIMLVAYLLTLFLPLTVAAQEANDASPTTAESTVATTNTGPPEPTGPENTSYTYNPETGLWENDYYTWDPATKQTAPKDAPTYSYNPETSHWDTQSYVYSPEQGKYVPQTVSAEAPTTEVSTPALESNEPAQIGSDTSKQPTLTTASIPATVVSGVSSPVPTNDLVVDNELSDDYFDLFYNASISNQISSTAVSGDASVIQNTVAGDATSGDASVIANVINMLQSSWDWQGSAPNLYTANIQGDYFGDIMINPNILAQANNSDCGCGDVEVYSETNNSINNDLDLLAQSGDATVSGNTSAGDATTGDASVIANLVNMISSSINSGSSFLGLLNVSGNLEGDVLMPQDVVNQLLASNVPTTDVSLCDCGDLSADITDNLAINNDIVTNASSGEATVSHNTSAGNATTGDASTKVTVFNLIGRNISAGNALLVFVNVQGQWIGFITNAPNGATAAALGDSVTNNSQYVPDSEYDIETTSTINNNVVASAQSGDADVTNNTRAGNATTGNASTAVNIANMAGTNFNLTGWFGVLFINVLGNWLGSFGTDTAYGGYQNHPTPTVDEVQNGPPTPIGQTAVARGGQGPAASGLASTRRPQVRVFSASFEEDSDGGIVLASMDEQMPGGPSGAATKLGAANSSNDGGGDIATYLLLASIGAAFVIIFHGTSLRSLVLRDTL